MARLAPGGGVWGVAASRDGRQVAAISTTTDAKGVLGPSRLTVWDTATGRELVRVTRVDQAEFVALNPDGSLVATYDSSEGEEAVRVIAVPGGAKRFAFRHAGRVTGLAFSPDGRALAAASSDVPVTLWDVSGRKR